MRVRRLTPFTIGAMIICAAPAAARAQEAHAVNPVELDAIVVQRGAEVATERDAIRQFLNRPDVADVAGRYGLDLKRAQDAVAVMSDADAARVAQMTRDAMPARAGGDALVISSTAVIIGLLIIILIIVA